MPNNLEEAFGQSFVFSCPLDETRPDIYIYLKSNYKAVFFTGSQESKRNSRYLCIYQAYYSSSRFSSSYYKDLNGKQKSARGILFKVELFLFTLMQRIRQEEITRTHQTRCWYYCVKLLQIGPSSSLKLILHLHSCYLFRFHLKVDQLRSGLLVRLATLLLNYSNLKSLWSDWNGAAAGGFFLLPVSNGEGSLNKCPSATHRRTNDHQRLWQMADSFQSSAWNHTSICIRALITWCFQVAIGELC